jgi:hypothetical protein
MADHKDFPSPVESADPDISIQKQAKPEYVKLQ